MKEIQFIGPTMAYEHIAFQVFKHINYHIAVITPNFHLLSRANKEVIFNVKAINNHDLDKITDRIIQLNNGSRISFVAQTQGDNCFRGHNYDIAFVIHDPLPHEMKLTLIPCLTSNPNSILYTVYDS